MSNTSFRLGSKSTGGFTLVEIMVVVVIIGLLAALAIPAFQRNRRNSQNTRMANDFRVFSQAFEIYNTQNGAWPDSAAAGAVPTLPVSISDTLRTSNWQSTTVFGGLWQWDNALASAGDAGICVTGFTCTDQQLGELDAKIDDGNLSTGRFRKTSSTRVIYILASGT
ncbi:MAG TPA: prepilin-type N-terminal cleavage/methylation domain-containing protein [Lacunisphaera sp.]